MFSKTITGKTLIKLLGKIYGNIVARCQLKRKWSLNLWLFPTMASSSPIDNSSRKHTCVLSRSAAAAAAAESLQSCPTLCDPIDGSPTGSPVPGILQARTLECVAISFSSLVAQSCPTLCDLMECSPPGSYVYGDSPSKNTEVGCQALLHGIFPTQGSKPRSPALQVDSLPSEPPGKPNTYIEG